MDQNRLKLHEALVEILGTEFVYFQPPPNIQMVYPCIVYMRDGEDAQFADNALYQHKQRYQVTSISPDVDSPIPGLIRQLPLCSYDRFFTADHLNHDVFTIFS